MSTRGDGTHVGARRQLIPQKKLMLQAATSTAQTPKAWRFARQDEGSVHAATDEAAGRIETELGQHDGGHIFTSGLIRIHSLDRVWHFQLAEMNSYDFEDFRL